MNNEYKKCTQCDQTKSLSNFYSRVAENKKKGRHIYYNPKCKKCSIDNSVANAKENYDRHLAGVKKNDSKPKRKLQMKEISQKKRDNGRYRSWQQSDNGKVRMKVSREKRKDKKHDISKNEIEQLYNYCSGKCMYCGMTEEEQLHKYNKKLFKDHAINRGSNRIDNCVLCCLPCSSSKRDRDWLAWYTAENPVFSEERFKLIRNWIHRESK